MNKILILGAGGMAGHVVAEYLLSCEKWEIICSARSLLTPETIVMDVTDFKYLEKVLKENKPDVVINCIGLLVQESLEKFDKAVLINSYLPHYLSRMGREIGYRLIHISTDCVFSGKDGGYSELSLRDGNTPYARTKALGEIDNVVDLTIRTSIIGPELKLNGTGLLHWFLKQTGEISGYQEVFWSGITTLALAKSIVGFLSDETTGIINLTMPERINKYDLLRLMKRVYEKSDLVIEPNNEYECDKSLICTRTDIDLHLPLSYEKMLIEMKSFMNVNSRWYEQYF